MDVTRQTIATKRVSVTAWIAGRGSGLVGTREEGKRWEAGYFTMNSGRWRNRSSSGIKNEEGLFEVDLIDLHDLRAFFSLAPALHPFGSEWLA